MPHALWRGWPTCRRWYDALLRRYRYGRGDGQARLGARRPDPVGEPGGRAAPARSTSAAARTSSCVDRSRALNGLRRAPVHAARPAERRRPDARAGGQAHRLGLHPRPAGRRRWTERHVERMEEQVERFAPGLPRPHPRPPRAAARPTSRRATRTSSAATSAAAATASTRSSSARCRSCRPVHDADRRACSSAAPRRSPAGRSTACRGTPRPRRTQVAALRDLVHLLAVDLVLVDLLGLGQRLVDLRDPRLLEDGDDRGAAGRHVLLDVGLDLLLLMVVEQPAGARADRAADHGRGQERGREDQPDDRAADGADRRQRARPRGRCP